MKDLPKAAAEAMREAAEGASVKQIEKSKIRAEINKEGESDKVVRLASPKYDMRLNSPKVTRRARSGSARMAR